MVDASYQRHKKFRILVVRSSNSDPDLRANLPCLMLAVETVKFVIRVRSVQH